MPQFQVASARDEFAVFWHENAPRWIRHPFAGFASEDQRQAFVIAKDQIQDTADALLVHRRQGFAECPFQCYVELWGLMQAVVLQQDAIFELAYAVNGKRPNRSPGGDWAAIRSFRDLLAGHSSRNFHSNPQRRCSIRRQTMNYSSIDYKVYEDGHPQRRSLNLGDLLDRYDAQAAVQLEPIFADLRAMIMALPGPDV